MREFKFRGICIASAKMIIGGGIDSQRDTPIIISQGKRYHVSEKTIGQFTGLQDKNGVDIYEGDVVKETRFLHFGKSILNKQVEFRGSSFKIGDLVISKYMGIDWEVIGNIYQNPELINNNL